MRHSLFLTPRFPPSPGGAETYASDLTRHLAEHGWRSFVVTDSSELENATASDDVITLRPPLEQLNDPRRVRWRSLQFGMLDELAQLMRGLPRIELVHANSIEAAVLGRLVADHLGVPLVATIHEHAPERQSFGLGRCRFVFERLDLNALIAPSEFYHRRALDNGFPAERAHRVLHGVSSARLFEREIVDLRSAWGVPASSWVATLIGRVYAPKGVLEFVEAARSLAADPRFRAVIVGPEGPGDYTREVLARIRAYALTDTVKLVGDLPPSLVPSAIRSSDVIVAPSLAEGFGLGVVEAMLLGTPVVVSRVGGLREIVEDGKTGVLVEPGNAAALGLALRDLLESPSTSARLAGVAETVARARFSAGRMAQETAHVYDALVETWARHESPRGTARFSSEHPPRVS